MTNDDGRGPRRPRPYLQRHYQMWPLWAAIALLIGAALFVGLAVVRATELDVGVVTEVTGG